MHPPDVTEPNGSTAAPPDVGVEAPDLDWFDAHGLPCTLRDLRGHPVVLTFFPGEWDPARADHLRQINALLKSLPGGGALVGAAPDRFWFDAELGPDERFRLPLLHDASTSPFWARRYGVEGRQATFLIDAGGRVRWRHLAPPGVRPSLEALAESLWALARDGGLSRRELLFTAVAVAVTAAAAPTEASAQPAEPRRPARGEGATLLNVNGKDVRVDGDPRITVLDALRERLGLTGTKKGCDHGQCGACTIHLDGRRVNACLVLAKQAEGRRIVTIEGLAQDGVLHPVQAAFVAHDGLQCGYCTPGQIMSATACLQEGHAESPEMVAEWMSGNLCRCGAYVGIRAAVLDARRSLRRPA